MTTPPPPPRPRRESERAPRSRPGAESAPRARPATEGAPRARPTTEGAPRARPTTEGAPRARPTTEGRPRPRPGAQYKPRRRPSLRGEQPTQTIPLRGSLRGTPYRDPRVTRAVAEEKAAAAALDLALRVAEIMLRCGSSAHAVETATVAVGVAAGLEDLDVDLTMQSMHMQCQTPSGQTISRLRVVRQPRQDFARLALVHTLVDDLVSGDLDIEQADAKLKEISKTPRTWSRWVVSLGEGGVAGGIALILGASLFGVALAMASAVIIIAIAGWIHRLDLPDFYLGALGGAVATVLAFIAYVLGAQGYIPITASDFAYVVAGGIVALLPSRTLTSATEDVLSGFPVTGTARLFAVMLHTFGLIVGVASGLGVCLQLAEFFQLGLVPPPINKLAWASAPLPVVVLGAAFIGFAGAITLQNNHRMLLPAGLLCTLGVAVASVMTASGVGRITATGVAAVFIGFFARLIALRMDSPSVTLFVPASFGLYPGLGIFIGLYHLTSPDSLPDGANMENGLLAVLGALGVIMAIATGATLGDRLAAPWDSPVAQRRKHAVEQESDRRTDEGWEIV